jgi:hypothetical protein
MSMDGKLRRRLERALGEVDEHGTAGPRLADDARRLFGRCRALLKMNVLTTETDQDAIELACFALQLPQRQTKVASGKLGRSSLKQRAEAAAEMLVTLLEDDTDEATVALLDRSTRLLGELPQRQPMLEEARLLADAVSLDDFGISGLVQLMIPLALQGGGVPQLIEALEKREQYGYWDARLKESFHFQVARDIARKRLERARQTAATLAAELVEDQP